MEDADGSVSVAGTRFDELLGAHEHAGALDLDEREPSLMLYTSGTTGRPKGVPRSHRADRAGGISQALQHGLRYGDRTLGVMPLYHTMGIHSLLAMSLIGGCFACQPRWSSAEALRLIEDERLTSLYLAPTLFHDLVTDLPTRRRRRGVGRGARIRGRRHDDVARAAVRGGVLAARVRQPLRVDRDLHVLGAPRPGGEAGLRRAAVAERPAPAREAGRRHGSGRRRRPGEEGQIACHLDSDEAFAGYWNRPDADAKAIRGGWYFTGDVGRVDHEGDLWIVGRVDDMIISGGENVHPLEVEEVLARHPSVRDVAVVGAPDDRWGQRIVAVVVADPGTTSEELDAHCLADETLARFKRPREYRFVDELPKSPSGKILRRLLGPRG